MRLDANEIAVDIDHARIVHDVTINVAPGELVGLVGPNGGGKSTCLRAIYRMLKPIAGQVMLGGDDVWQLSARQSAQRIGVVAQETSSDFDFTVSEVVDMGRIPHKGVLSADVREDTLIAQDALARVGMLSFTNRSFRTLSGGEKQRVLVARALAQQPKLLVLDEPTNHLDIQHQLELLELVRGLDITTLMTLHDLNLAASYCQRLYVLTDGRIAAAGTPRAVLTPALLRDVFGVEAVCGAHPITGALQLAFMPLSK
jgi:iron complex transport system ATP-binding protein